MIDFLIDLLMWICGFITAYKLFYGTRIWGV